MSGEAAGPSGGPSQPNFNKNKIKNSTPAEWTLYSDFGTLIEGTRLLPCRVPLRPTIRKEFTPQDLIDRVSSSGLGRLAMVVDLTDTFRYYDPRSAFEEQGVRHRKIRCPGACVPPDFVSEEFAQAMSDFEAEFGAEPEAVVAVHCTHGVNRTGFVIARWLMAAKGWARQDALDAFRTARGHPMAKHSAALEAVEAGRPIDRSGERPLRQPPSAQWDWRQAQPAPHPPHRQPGRWDAPAPTHHRHQPFDGVRDGAGGGGGGRGGERRDEGRWGGQARRDDRRWGGAGQRWDDRDQRAMRRHDRWEEQPRRGERGGGWGGAGPVRGRDYF